MTERKSEVCRYALDNGKFDAAYKYGIEVSTVERYIRAYYENQKEDEVAPVITIFDIETLGIIASVWNVWNVNINPVDIIKDWSLLSMSWKQLGGDKVHNAVLTSEQAIDRDDKELTIQAWAVLDESDVVITYNGNKFDIRKLNAKFIEYGLGQPSPYKKIDLYQAVKKQFANTYNRMDYVNKIIGIDRKLEHQGKQLWMDCDNGVQEALDKMAAYNDVDVEITEQLYLSIIDWIPNHPNMALYYSDEEPMCHKCASIDVTLSEHKHYTSASVFDVYVCPHCNSYSRHKKRISTTDLRPL